MELASIVLKTELCVLLPVPDLLPPSPHTSLSRQITPDWDADCRSRASLRACEASQKTRRWFCTHVPLAITLCVPFTCSSKLNRSRERLNGSINGSIRSAVRFLAFWRRRRAAAAMGVILTWYQPCLFAYSSCIDAVHLCVGCRMDFIAFV